MVRISNAIVGFLNSISLLLGLAAIAASIYFYVHGGASQCQQTLQLPLLIVGAFIFVVSLLGLVGSCCRVNFVLVLYLTVMFLLILGLIALTVFAILVTNAGVGNAVSQKGYKEYRLGDYSNWLQNNFVKGDRWIKIKNCLLDAHVCSSLVDPTKFSDFYKKNLSPIQSGCCQPPSFCAFEPKNATFWEPPKTGPAVNESDCKAWRNEQDALCFECDMCKVGVLDNIRKEWRHLAIFNAIAIAVIVFVYCVGCCARRNNKADKKSYIYRGGWA